LRNQVNLGDYSIQLFKKKNWKFCANRTILGQVVPWVELICLPWQHHRFYSCTHLCCEIIQKKNILSQKPWLSGNNTFPLDLWLPVKIVDLAFYSSFYSSFLPSFCALYIHQADKVKRHYSISGWVYYRQMCTQYTKKSVSISGIVMWRIWLRRWACCWRCGVHRSLGWIWTVISIHCATVGAGVGWWSTWCPCHKILQ
jgi:hypothetical protein